MQGNTARVAMLKTVALGIAALMLVGAKGGGSGVHLGPKDNGRRIQLRVEDQFTLTLRTNPSTGYSWKVVSSGEPVIRQLGEAEFTPDSHMAGAGGTERYTFRADNAGTAALKLVYVRPWEKDAEPVNTFAVTLVVTK